MPSDKIHEQCRYHETLHQSVQQQKESIDELAKITRSISEWRAADQAAQDSTDRKLSEICGRLDRMEKQQRQAELDMPTYYATKDEVIRKEREIRHAIDDANNRIIEARKEFDGKLLKVAALSISAAGVISGFIRMFI